LELLCIAIPPLLSCLCSEHGLYLSGRLNEGGVALAAIKGLNEKPEQEGKNKDAEIQQLRQRLEKLEQLMNQKTRGAK